MKSRLLVVIREVVTIVFSVIVALQFQDCYQQRREQRLAVAARGAIQREILHNWAELQGVQSANQAYLRHVDDLRASGPHWSLNNVNLMSPTLLSAAWDSALATHAVNAMSLEETTRFASLYKFQGAIEATTNGISSTFLSSMLVFREEDRDAAQPLLRSYERSLRIIIEANGQLIEQYGQALR